MLMVLQVHRRTTSLALLKKVVLHKIEIQVTLRLLKINREIPLYREKGNLIDIYAMAIFNFGKVSF